MKKIAIIMITFFLMSCFISCTDKQIEPQQKQKELFEYEQITPMSEELKTRVLTLCYEKYVRDEYPAQSIDDLKIDYDLGNRNGNYVFIFSDGREYDDDPMKREYETVKTIPYRFGSDSYVDYIGYYYDSGRPMRVYNGDAVYGFTEAFEKGLMSEGDMEFFLQCKHCVVENRRMQKRMDKDLENAMMEYVINNVFWGGQEDSKDYYHKYRVMIKYYLGTYGDKVVVGLSEGLESDIYFMQNIEIDDIILLQDMNYPWCVFDGNSFVVLEKAYANGAITREDLLSIAEKANSEELPIYNSSFFS